MRFSIFFLLLFLLPSQALALSPLPAFILPVPYTSQAPDGRWIEPWKNACEETTITMVDAYYGNRTLNRTSGTAGIRLALRLREHHHGKSLDESAEVMKEVINAYYPWEATIVRNPTLSHILEEIKARRPVIALTHGKALKNPRFQDGGPDYHTIVLSGYDDTTKEFITEEPGTSIGAHHRYPYDTVMNALHDFVPNKKTNTGVPTVLFTSSQLVTSAQTDGDGDGLSKQEELRHGTVLYFTDSDGDGYTDGEEVTLGYLPTKNERALPTGSLIKSQNSPMVYRLEGGKKRHIFNEQVFLNHGWKWSQIVLVSEKFLENVALGTSITR